VHMTLALGGASGRPWSSDDSRAVQEALARLLPGVRARPPRPPVVSALGGCQLVVFVTFAT